VCNEHLKPWNNTSDAMSTYKFGTLRSSHLLYKDKLLPSRCSFADCESSIDFLLAPWMMIDINNGTFWERYFLSRFHRNLHMLEKTSHNSLNYVNKDGRNLDNSCVVCQTFRGKALQWWCQWHPPEEHIDKTNGETREFSVGKFLSAKGPPEGSPVILSFFLKNTRHSERPVE